MKYLENQHILVDEQGGFQPNHSTILTTSYLTDYIFSAMNNNQITHTVFIDFKKAFDTINHKILLNKLKRLGFHQNAIKWFQNYLTNRTQRTFANKLISSELPIICGVPQGSILGPLMFLIYINDLTTCIKHSQCRLFADDTVLYVSCGSSSEAKVNLQADLDNLSQWCQKNQLTINTIKTKGMSFGNKRLLDRDLPLDLKLNGVSLMNVQNYKYLGIILDPNLSFAKHIANLVSVVNFKAYSFTKFRHMLYKSMILPYLDYGDSIYGGANQDLLQKLQRLQNRCLCIATYQFGHTDTTELHKQTKTSFLNQRRETHLLNLMFRKKNDTDLLDLRLLNTRQHDGIIFKIPHPNLQKFQRSTFYRGAQLWNRLPLVERTTFKYETFKHRNKTKMLTALANM